MIKTLRFSLLSMLMMLCGSVMAEEVTIDFDNDYQTLFPTLEGTSSNDSHAGDFTENTTSTAVGGVTVTVSAKTKGSNENRIWNSAPRLRMYSGSFTVNSQKTITKIEFTGHNTNFNLSTTTGTLSGKTWTGEATEIVFAVAKNTQINKMVLTLEDDAETISKPVFTPNGAEFEESVTVTIAAQEGATILYHLGNQQWAEYTEALLLTETTTVYAKAVKGDLESAEVSATFTKVEPVVVQTLSVEEALDIINTLANKAKTSEEYQVKGFVVGAPDFQRDKSGALYGNVNLTIADEKGGETTLTVFRAKDFNKDSFTEETISRLKENDEVVFQGLLQNYNGTPELTDGWLISVVPAEEPAVKLAAPTIAPNGGEFTAPVTVTLTHADAEAEIWYSLNAGVPKVYTEPFTLTTTTKVVAYAKKDGQVSATSSALFTINIEEEPQPVELTGEGTLESPYTVADALSLIDELANGAKSEDKVYVKGIIVEVSEISMQYGNATFTIADEAGANALTVFRAKSFNGENFTEETLDLFAEGYTVVVEGQLQKYVSKDGEVTFEIVSGKLISVEKPDITDGIADVQTKANATETVFNLRGQRVAQPVKGLYIMNGKKVVVK